VKDSAVTNIAGSSVSGRTYSYGSNYMVKTWFDTPSKEGDSSYFKDGLLMRYVYLNDKTAVAEENYNYDNTSPNNPFNIIKAAFLIDNHLCSSTKLPNSYSYKSPGSVTNNYNGNYTYQTDASGRVIGIRHISGRVKASTVIVY